MFLPEEREKVISLLNQGVCPYCGKDGFKLVGLHISHVHETTMSKLKDELMLPRIKGFPSPETKALMSARTIKCNSAENIRAYSTKGLKYDESSKQKLKRQANLPERKTEFVRKMTTEGVIQKNQETRRRKYTEMSEQEKADFHLLRRKAGMASAEKRRKLTAQQETEILNLIQ